MDSQTSKPRPVRGSVLIGVAVLAAVAIVAASLVLARPAAGAAKAAQGFLTALADRDATDALSRLVRRPVDQRLLTDKALAEATAIGDIVVREHAGGTPDRTLVDVAYTLGDTAVTDTYRLRQFGRDWYIDEDLPRAPSYGGCCGLVEAYPPGVGLLVDSVPIEPGWSRPPVFPGVHSFSLDSDLVEVADAVFTVASLHAPVRANPETRLSTKGREVVRDAASSALAACLKETTLTTSCGFGFSELDAEHYFPDREGDALWTLEPGSGTLDGAEPEWGACALSTPSHTGVCAENINLMARVTVKTKSGGTASRIARLNGYLADLSDATRIRIVFTET